MTYKWHKYHPRPTGDFGYGGPRWGLRTEDNQEDASVIYTDEPDVWHVITWDKDDAACEEPAHSSIFFGTLKEAKTYIAAVCRLQE